MAKSETHRVLITGSRNWVNPFIVGKAIEEYWAEVIYHSWSWPGDLVIVHGECPTGADHWADLWAKTHEYEVEPHPAQWDLYGKFAGPKRNMEMVDLGANVVLAFPHSDSRSTVQCMKYAKEKGLRVEEFTE